MTKLNENEMTVLQALAQEVQNCTGGEFGYANDAQKPVGMSKHSFSGYVAQMAQKGLVEISHDEFRQMTMTQKGVDALAGADGFVGRRFVVGFGDVVEVQAAAVEIIPDGTMVVIGERGVAEVESSSAKTGVHFVRFVASARTEYTKAVQMREATEEEVRQAVEARELLKDKIDGLRAGRKLFTTGDKVTVEGRSGTVGTVIEEGLVYEVRFDDGDAAKFLPQQIAAVSGKPKAARTKKEKGGKAPKAGKTVRTPKAAEAGSAAEQVLAIVAAAKEPVRRTDLPGLALKQVAVRLAAQGKIQATYDGGRVMYSAAV